MFWAMLIQPLVAFVLFGLALWLSRQVLRVPMPFWLLRSLLRPIGRRRTRAPRPGRPL